MQKSFSYLLMIILLLTNLLLLSCQKDKPINQQPNPNLGNSNNTLLANPQKGSPLTGNPSTTGDINDFTFASNGTDVVLVIANDASKKLYAIDIQDNDATQAAANAITSPITGFKPKVAASMGVTPSQIDIVDMAVNPISKAVYLLVLVQGNTNITPRLLKITGGRTITAVDLSNVFYTAITFSTNNSYIKDMTWGENELYVSMVQGDGLGGAVGKIGIPFTHNTSATTRNTTVFTHGRYSTDAPLEKMVYGKVKGEGRLMGVTTCAPGFSFKASKLNTSGLLQVKEYFNLDGGQPRKVVSVMQGNNTYLVELHGYYNRIVKIGEKFIDESQTDNNVNSKFLITGGVRTDGLTDDDIKIYNGVYYIMAKYTEDQILVIDNTDKLSLLTL